MAEHSAHAAEVNEGIARLVAWAADPANRYREVRLARRHEHHGVLSVTPTTRPDGTVSTTVRVRDARRSGGRQYAPVFALEDVEVKVGRRYAPAAEVVE